MAVVVKTVLDPILVGREFAAHFGVCFFLFIYGDWDVHWRSTGPPPPPGKVARARPRIPSKAVLVPFKWECVTRAPLKSDMNQGCAVLRGPC